MAGLKDEDIYAVRTSVTMRQIVGYYGFELHHGDMICCPIHGHDDNPSMKIYPGSRGYYCFACHAGGDTIDFIQRYEGLEFQDAVKRLAKIFGIPLSGGDDLPEDVKSKIAEMKRQQESTTRLRNLANNRLKELSGTIKRLEYWKGMCEPLDALWCALTKKIEKAEIEWEFLFNEGQITEQQQASNENREATHGQS